MNPPPLITAQTEEKLLAFLTESGHTKFRVQQIMDWVWRKRVASFDAMTNLSPALRSLLAENFRFHTPEIVEISGTPGSTRKFLTRMEDGQFGRIRHHPRRRCGGRRKGGPDHPLRLLPGGLRLRLQILRFRPAGAQAQPLRGGNHPDRYSPRNPLPEKGSTTSSSWEWGNPSPTLTTCMMLWKSSPPTAGWK